MSPRILAVPLLLAVACTGGEASACFINNITYFGPKPSKSELRAREKESSAEQVKFGTLQARRDWPGAAGGAKALAELLVPNVRPVPIERSDCGPMNEVDFADGEEEPNDLLMGTPYAGRADQYTDIFWSYDGKRPGAMCNAEVRDRFAVHLRRRLTPEALREAYVFLGARRPSANLTVRMTAFDGRSRRPPLRWMARDARTDEQVRRWLRHQPAGRALKSATDEFWAGAEPMLADSSLLCPAAVAAWPAERAVLLNKIEALAAERRAYIEAYIKAKPAS